MQTEALSSQTHSCYSRNAAALSARQPGVVAIVSTTALPENIHAVMGRDGTPTFRMEDDLGGSLSAGRRSYWFGGSSMPGISAREVLASFVSDGRNVILPGVLSGMEPLVLAERLPPHAAVFVVEADPVQLKLALSAHDYTELIESGRLVFVLGGGEACIDGLRDFFEAQPGYEFPRHLTTVPQRTAAQIAELQIGMESASREIVSVHARVVKSLSERLSTGSRGALPVAPSVAVLGVDPMPVSLAQARRIDRALTEMNWVHSVCVPDAPRRCHLAARLASVDQIHADMILLTNTAVGLSGADLPGDLPLGSWHLPGSLSPAPGTVSPDSPQVYFASSQSVHDGLMGAGCRANMIEHCGVAADTVAFRPLDSSEIDRDRLNTEVAVIADLPDAQAEGCNITLDSHVTLWRALTEVVHRHVDEDLAGMSETLMAEAQELSHAAVHEPEVLEQFVGMLQARLVPAVSARSAVEALRALGHSVGVWGSNWTSWENGAEAWQGGTHTPALPIPDEESLNQIFNTVSVVVIADARPWGVQTALDAVAAGSAVVCSGGADAFAREHPGLTAVQGILHLYNTRRELVRHVESLVGVSRHGKDISAETELVRKEHSVARRLEQIASALRRRQPQKEEG